MHTGAALRIGVQAVLQCHARRSRVWGPTFPYRVCAAAGSPRCSCCAAAPHEAAPPRLTECAAVDGSPGVRALLARDWLLKRPDSQLKHVGGVGSSAGAGGFWLVRDDLLHPVAGGNKLRKLDALLPQLRAAGATDIITCGGLQSAHTAAVAALCAEQGLRAHLLVRGERPAVPTGLHLYARMYGNVTYIPRSEYTDRGAMFEAHTARVRAEGGDGLHVAVIKEGGVEPAALLGLLRLAEFLAREDQLGRQLPCNFIIDCGTGVTAIGLALAAALLELPWRVTGIMLAAPLEYYRDQTHSLLAAFMEQYGPQLGEPLGAAGRSVVPQQRPHTAVESGGKMEDGRLLESGGTSAGNGSQGWGGPMGAGDILNADHLRLEWVERSTPRKFGKVLPGELHTCAGIAKQHGVLLDPLWTLASWQAAQQLVEQAKVQGQGALESAAEVRAAEEDERVVVLMTGGGLGLHGLAQRWPADF